MDDGNKLENRKGREGKGGKRKREKNEVNEYDNEFGSLRIGKGRERTKVAKEEK